MLSMQPNTPNDSYPDHIDYYTVKRTRGFGASNTMNPFSNTSDNLDDRTGFRCARTIPGSYTGNNE